MGELIPFGGGRRPPRGRRSRHPWPEAWRPYVRRCGWAELRLMIWAGLLLGLLVFQAFRLLPAPYQPVEASPVTYPAPPPSTYAESERSRQILEGQEGAPSGSAAGTREGSGTQRASGPVRVIDGDTFDYAGMRVRIADIDAPEVNGRCPYEIELAARATGRARALLAAGPFELHRLGNGRDEDGYGRKLRIVTRDGQSLGDVLVSEGLARTWTGRREPWCV